ncbi:MAG: hypothetical protein M0R32_09640 [Candidatus Cloacimonetes bacterium]|jgi:hypothetical protein|nr:hypothetical protein [Candidatus Cloacimonadota bacterium]
MSKAWNVTAEDIAEILEAHESTADSVKIFEGFKDELRVEKAVLWYSDYSSQVDAAKDELEDILIEQGVIEKPKRFSAP